MRVTFDDCRVELLHRAGGPAFHAYEAWRHRPGYDHVVTFVESFTHEQLYTIDRVAIEDARRRSSHALGDVDTSEQLPEVEDFTCPFAFQHLFHWYLEHKGDVPSWDQMRLWLLEDVRDHFVEPLLTATGWQTATAQRRRQLSRAIRWRIGKFYYSTMRELDLLVRVRERSGLPLRYHLLADVLLRIDFWHEDTVICAFFPNARYRAAGSGRKPQAETFLRDAQPPFRILPVEIERQGFGEFWLATEQSVSEVAALIAG